MTEPARSDRSGLAVIAGVTLALTCCAAGALPAAVVGSVAAVLLLITTRAALRLRRWRHTNQRGKLA